MRRFIRTRNSIPSVSDETVVKAFKFGVRDRRLTEDLEITTKLDVNKLFRMVERYADANDVVRWKRDYGQGKLGFIFDETGPSNTKADGLGPRDKRRKRDCDGGNGRLRVVAAMNSWHEVMEVRQPDREEPHPR